MTDREGQPPTMPVESLSDIAWQRVEKGLFAALDCDNSVEAQAASPRRRPTPMWLLAGVVAAATAALMLTLWRVESSPAPRVEVAAAPSRVVTQEAPSAVSFGEADITVAARSAVTMHGDAEHGVLVVLERGTASFAVAPRRGRPPFTVQAGDVMVRVVGTRFTIARSGDAARVEVIEGRVEVVAGGHRELVEAGGSWSSSGTAAAQRFNEAGPPGAVPGGAAPAPVPSPAPAKRAAKAATTPRPRESASPPSPPSDDRVRYERAAALEATDPDAALLAYRAIAGGEGPWASTALFAAGRLAAERRDGDAAALLRAYLRRFPQGANAADARILLERLGT